MVTYTEQAAVNTNDVVAFFQSKGLEKYAMKLLEVTEADSLEDLKLIDDTIAESIIHETQMKALTAKKFRLAISELQGSTPSEQDAVTVEPPMDDTPTGEVSVTKETPLKECVVICIDRSGSMGTPFSTERTRMEAVKQMFYAFRDRTENVGAGGHMLGLIQFDDKVETLLPLTRQLDQFESIVDDMERRGMTAIYSSICSAVEMLRPVFDSDSSVDLRIVALTDGQSNSGLPAQQALHLVNDIGAVVDAIIVGTNPDANLRKIVSATGGECFQINDLGEGFELLESESVVSLAARRGGGEKPAFVKRPPVELASLIEKSMGKAPSAPQPTRSVGKIATVDALPAEAVRTGGVSGKRAMKEIRDVSRGEIGEGVHIFPSPDDICCWKALIEGPAGSPFENGVFCLGVELPSDYPFRPPHIKFETPIYHCNVSDTGRVCLDILMDKWTPSLSVVKCLEVIRMLLKEPDTDNALRQWIAELTISHINSKGQDTTYVDNCRAETSAHASLTVEEWKTKWGC